MRDIALDPETGDIKIPLQLVEGAECLAQQLRIRFRFLKGDWFLNLEEGIPYLEDILGKKTEVEQVSALFRLVVETTPGVDSVQFLNATLDPSTRELSVSFSVVYKDEIVSGNEVFIL